MEAHRKITIGRGLRGNDVHFGVAGIHKMHCCMSVTSDGDIVLLQPMSGALVSVNAHSAVEGGIKINIGDYILFAQSILFVLCSIKPIE